MSAVCGSCGRRMSADTVNMLDQCLGCGETPFQSAEGLGDVAGDLAAHLDGAEFESEGYETHTDMSVVLDDGRAMFTFAIVPLDARPAEYVPAFRVTVERIEP